MVIETFLLVVEIHFFLRLYIFQVEVVKSFNDPDGPQWKHSLFGNPNDPDTFRLVFLMLCCHVSSIN